MKKTFIFLLLGVTIFSACKKKDSTANSTPEPTCNLLSVNKDDGTKTRYTYDTKGRLIGVANVDPSSGYDSLTLDSVSYGTNGKVVLYSFYNAYGVMDQYITFRYNSDGTLAENDDYDLYGFMQNYVTYTYNSAKRIIRLAYPSGSNNLYVVALRYDSRGNVSSVIDYDVNNAVTDSTNYKYDYNTNIYKNIDANIRAAIYPNYDYTAWGPDNVIEAAVYTNQGTISHSDTYTYQTNGGQITKLIYSSTSKAFPGYNKTFTYNCH